MTELALFWAARHVRQLRKGKSVAGYLGKAAKGLIRGEAALEEFIRVRLLRILSGDVHGVVRGLRRMATVQKLSNDKRAEVDAACGYFTAHANRMKYDEYLAAGLPIATGVIEGACRHPVNDRRERTGMLWSASSPQPNSPQGGNAASAVTLGQTLSPL